MLGLGPIAPNGAPCARSGGPRGVRADGAREGPRGAFRAVPAAGAVRARRRALVV